MTEMYQKFEDFCSNKNRRTFGTSQSKLEFVFQATRPDTSTWRCALYGQVLKGKISRPSKITLPPRSRTRRGIPATSEWFSFLYPKDEEESTTKIKRSKRQEISNEEAAALESITKAGAFVYFSQQNDGLSEFDLKLDAVKSVGEIQGFSTATITFKPWELISSEVNMQLECRAVKVTFPKLIEEKVEKFLWLSPSERHGLNSSEHGGFVYWFKDYEYAAMLPIDRMATINTNEKAFLETLDLGIQMGCDNEETLDLGIQMGCDNEEFSVNPIAWKDSASDEDETYFYAVG